MIKIILNLKKNYLMKNHIINKFLNILNFNLNYLFYFFKLNIHKFNIHLLIII